MTPNHSSAPEVLTLSEFSSRVRVQAGTVRSLARRGRIPGSFKVGSVWRVDWEAFRAASKVPEGWGRGKTRRSAPPHFVAEFFESLGRGRLA